MVRMERAAKRKEPVCKYMHTGSTFKKETVL